MELFTDEQIKKISIGIKIARQSMVINGAEPEIFLEAFIKAGGIQVPGHEINKDDQQNIGDHALKSLRGSPSFMSKPDYIRDTIRREMGRAYSETYIQTGIKTDDVIGYRLLADGTTNNNNQCTQLINKNLYGLGKGVYPKNEIIVLQPYCDRCYLEVVFDDEI